jgi:hypothetical protein
MAKSKTAKLKGDAGPYLRRLLEDERVHDNLSDAAARLRKAYRRAERKKKGAKAAEDKKLYEHVRGAAGSLRGAAMALQRKPPPKPKRRGRKILMVGALGGGAWLLAKRGSDRSEAEMQAVGSPEPLQRASADQTSATPVSTT